jgi:archaellum component FlaC
MADIDARLDRLEQGLTSMNEQLGEVNARLGRHDERFNQIDGRFTKVVERFDSVESAVQKLRVLDEDNSTQIRLIAEVQAHHGTVLDQIVKDIEPLKRQAATVELIAKEIEPLKRQAATVERIARDIEPLKDFVTRVVDEHERRITALEQSRANGSPRS